MSVKKHTLRVTILNEEYAIRSDTPPEHARAVASYLDQAIRKVMSSGAVVESNRAVVLAALQITAELFDARGALDSTTESMEGLAEYVRPLLPPSKRQIAGGAA
jgi:cell division protein ZapA